MYAYIGHGNGGDRAGLKKWGPCSVETVGPPQARTQDFYLEGPMALPLVPP
jgi:hypothetical protein